MITAEVRINGTLLGVMTCVNKGVTATSDVDRYEGEYYVVHEGVAGFKLTHRRGDGHKVLLAKIFKQLGG